LVNSFEVLVYKLQNLEEVGDGELRFEDEEKDVPICNVVKEMEKLIQELQTAHELFDGTAQRENTPQQKRKRGSDDDPSTPQRENLVENLSGLISDGKTAFRRQRMFVKRKLKSLFQWPYVQRLVNAEKGKCIQVFVFLSLFLFN
jgi:hypothetical protein